MRAIVTETKWVLRFSTGEYFVDNTDLHHTTYTTYPSEATIFSTAALAQARVDAMARTQGVKLVREQVG